MLVKNMKTILDSNKYDNCECNFKLKSKGPQVPEWFKEFSTEVFSRLDKIDTRLDKIDEFIVEQKKFNQYVLDVFKRNNLK